MLLGTSMNMHLDKTALVPMRGHESRARSALAGQLEQAPLFQPFSCPCSMTSRVIGRNVFVLTPCSPSCCDPDLCHGLPDQRARAGAVAVLRWPALPCWPRTPRAADSNCSTGDDSRHPPAGHALCGPAGRQLARGVRLAGILLANTRYESVLFLLPVGLTVLGLVERTGRPGDMAGRGHAADDAALCAAKQGIQRAACVLGDGQPAGLRTSPFPRPSFPTTSHTT